MLKSKTATFVTVSVPRTPWREPSRALDSLLKLPRGYPLKPTEKLQKEILLRTATGVKADAAAMGDGEVSGEEDVVVFEDWKAPDETPEKRQEAPVGTLDGTMEQRMEYDGDAEDGSEAPEQSTVAQTYDMAGEQGNMSNSDSQAELGSDDLLFGEERSTDDEHRHTLTTPTVQAGVRIYTQNGPYASRVCVHRAKVLREGTESIRPHPTDASKVIITYRYIDSAGSVYVQETEMPEAVPATACASSKPGSIIYPDVETSKVPRTKKGSPWHPIPNTSCYEWTRGDASQRETWRIVVFFRRLNRTTHAYQDIYTNTNMLTSINPNDKKFRTAYNKWVLQFARRRDATYTQKVARVHWSAAERVALYTAINSFCARFGIHRFGFTDECKISTKQLQRMADIVNAVPNPLRNAPRGVDAVRGQIVSAHDKVRPKNKAVFDLMGRGVELRARIARGEVVPRAERKPRLAIALSEFPVECPVAASARSPAQGSRKHKRAAADGESDVEPSSSELSSSPASGILEGDSVGEDTWMTTDEEIAPGKSEEGSWSDADQEALPGEGEDRWIEEKEALPSPSAKKARTTR